jgi:uncharacterized protein
MSELIYRPWYFPRPQLARKYLDLLMGGPGDPLALFAPRRIGKTSFLLNDLSREAERRGLASIYIDMWQNRGDALSAINYALQEALDDLTVPRSTTARRLKTTVRKLGVGGASLELGDEPTRHRPQEPALLVDWLLKEYLRAVRKPVLLMFDEIQELANARGGEIAVSALRSAVTKSRDRVRIIFTGSSQEQLLELFTKSRAALYEGASLAQFPSLDRAFVEFIAERAKQRYRKTVSVTELQNAFERLHFQPRALLDLVFVYCASEQKDLEAILDAQWQALLESSEFDSRWQALKPLHQALCRRIAFGQEFSSAEARREYSSRLGRKGQAISPGSVNSAIRQLLRSHLIARTPSGPQPYLVEDALFAEWIRRHFQGQGFSA